MINKFEKLHAWQSAMELAEEVYLLTKDFPQNELFALANQMARCGVSIPSNIAEGCSRSSAKDKKHFFEIAIGSIFELKTQIEIAYRQKYITLSQKAKVDILIDQTVKLLYGLKRSINDKT